MTCYYRAALVAALTLPALFGSVLLPGTSAPPDVFANTPTGALLASTSGNINPSASNPSLGVTFNGAYSEYVYRDTAQSISAGCTAIGGCLDFFFIFTNVGPAGTIIERATLASFDSFTVDAGYDTVTSFLPTGGSNVHPSSTPDLPSSVDRGPVASGVVGFNFTSGTGGGPVGSGATSALLEIQTNAVNFIPGVISLQDGTAGSANGFAPASAAPEPSTIFLLGSALVLVGVHRRKQVRR